MTPEEILELFKKAEANRYAKEISSETSTISKIENVNAAQKALTLFQTFDNIGKQPMPKTYEDLARIVKIRTEVAPEYVPKMGTAEYTAKAVYAKIAERPIYALGEGAAGALEFGARKVGLKGLADYFKGSKEMWKTPPVSKDVDEQFAWLLDSAKKKSATYGVVVEMAEIGAQIGALMIQMGLLGKVPAIKNIGVGALGGVAPLTAVAKSMGAQFVHGFTTTPGDLSNRFYAATYRMANAMTPYLTNATKAVGWGARAVDTGLNTFVTMPSYIKAAKSAKNPADFIMQAMPQFMVDFITALDTTGSPENQRIAALNKIPGLVNTTRAEKVGFLKAIDAGREDAIRVYGDEVPEPTKQQVVETEVVKAKFFRGELPSQKVFKTAQEKLDYDAKMFGNTHIRVQLYDIAKKLGINLSNVASDDVVWVTKEEYIAKRYGEVKEVKMPEDTITLIEDGEGGALILKNSKKYMETALVPSKFKPKQILPALTPEGPTGIILTKAEVKARAALAKKAAFREKMDALIDPINKGRILPDKQQPLVVSERKNFWGRFKDGALMFHTNNLRAERMAGELDGYRNGANTEVIYNRPNEATSKELTGFNAGADAVRATLDTLGIKNLFEFYGQRKPIGDNMLLSDNEMVDMYMCAQSKEGVRHLTTPKEKNGMGFTTKDLTLISEAVEASPQMKGLSDWLFKKYDEQFPEISRVFTEETGEVLGKLPYYAPLRVLKEFINFEKENIAQETFNRQRAGTYAFVEKGFTEARQAGAKQPIRIDALGNYLYNLSRTQHYINFAMPIKDLRSVLNDTAWKNAVIQKKGFAFYKNLVDYEGAIAGTRPGVAFDLADKGMNFLRRSSGVAFLGFNILTVMRQPLSFLTASGEIGLSHTLNGLRQLAFDPEGIQEFVYERSPQMKYREGQFENVVAEIQHTQSIPRFLAEKPGLGKISMAAAAYMDKMTTLSVWKGTYDRVMFTGKTIDGDIIPAKNLDKAASLEADAVVRRTQAMASVKDLPGWHRGGTAARMFTMFQNEINNNFNYYRYDVIGKVKSGQITPANAAYKVLFALVLPALVEGMMTRGGLPKDKKQVIEDLVTYPLGGYFLVGGIVDNMIKKYSSYGTPALQGLTDIVKVGQVKSWGKKAKYGLKGVAEITGIPYSQVYRSYMGLLALLNNETDDWRRIVWSEYALKGGVSTGEQGLQRFKRQ